MKSQSNPLRRVVNVSGNHNSESKRQAVVTQLCNSLQLLTPQKHRRTACPSAKIDVKSPHQKLKNCCNLHVSSTHAFGCEDKVAMRDDMVLRVSMMTSFLQQYVL